MKYFLIPLGDLLMCIFMYVCFLIGITAAILIWLFCEPFVASWHFNFSNEKCPIAFYDAEKKEIIEDLKKPIQPIKKWFK